mmetsp:Transcript_3931/g.11290  ORF Transcript_3931/g.11290 Transcript_3931/m.11290 type:complete len:318 (+) Transcript_3931:2015-2968(+)
MRHVSQLILCELEQPLPGDFIPEETPPQCTSLLPERRVADSQELKRMPIVHQILHLIQLDPLAKRDSQLVIVRIEGVNRFRKLPLGRVRLFVIVERLVCGRVGVFRPDRPPRLPNHLQPIKHPLPRQHHEILPRPDIIRVHCGHFLLLVLDTPQRILHLPSCHLDGKLVRAQDPSHRVPQLRHNLHPPSILLGQLVHQTQIVVTRVIPAAREALPQTVPVVARQARLGRRHGWRQETRRIRLSRCPRHVQEEHERVDPVPALPFRAHRNSPVLGGKGVDQRATVVPARGHHLYRDRYHRRPDEHRHGPERAPGGHGS